MRKPVKSTLNSPFLRRLWLDPKAELPQEFPGTLPFLKTRDFEIEFTTPVTIFVGENATGKSTLLEAIADNCGFHQGGGSRDHSYSGPDSARAPLAKLLKFSWLPKISNGFFFRADSYRNLASYIDAVGNLDYWGGKPLLRKSHGETFLALFENRLQSHAQSIFLMDEPESALSPKWQLRLLRLIHDWSTSGKTQVILATHAPLLMALPRATLLYSDRDGLREINYRATPHFQTLAAFFADPDNMVATALTARADS